MTDKEKLYYYDLLDDLSKAKPGENFNVSLNYLEETFSYEGFFEMLKLLSSLACNNATVSLNLGKNKAGDVTVSMGIRAKEEEEIVLDHRDYETLFSKQDRGYYCDQCEYRSDNGGDCEDWSLNETELEEVNCKTRDCKHCPSSCRCFGDIDY